MNFKKLVVFGLVLCLAFGLLANGQQEAQRASTVVYNSMHGDPAPREADEELVRRFQEETGTNVIHSIIAHEDFKTAIRAYLTASNAPDVLTWFGGERARYFINRGLIMDISDLWEEAGWNEDYSAGFKALSTVNGKQYFVPTAWYWWGVYYRPSVFEKHGIEAPETWDDFMVVCEKLKANGVTPLTIGTMYRWTAAAWFDYFNMRVNGPDFHISLLDGNESWLDPRVKKIFTDYWGPMIEKGYFIDSPASYTWAEAIPFMANESAAMYLMGDFIRDSFPADLMDDLDFFQFPIIDASVPVGENAPTDGYFIPTNAQNPEGARELLKYIGSAEWQQYTADTLNRLNTNSKVDTSVFTDSQQKGIDMIQNADYVAQFFDRDTLPEMADDGMNGMMEFWQNPGNIDSILQRLERTRLSLFEN